MNIILLEAFFTGSHRKWALELQKHSSHQIQILSLPGKFWKWRMHGGAISLAEQVNQLGYLPDLFLATDMMDLALFRSLLKPEYQTISTAIYFHENQITYPWSPTDRDIIYDRDRHYGFINYTSALVADQIFFNSTYHRNSFLEALPKFLKAFPDHRNMSTIEQIGTKSKVLHLGLNLSKIDQYTSHVPERNERIILWNHRWEYDKNPESFFHVLYDLKREQIPFGLIVLGENTSFKPSIFDEAKEILKDQIVHWGYAESSELYIRLLKSADYLPVTSNHDFFGISIIEAVYAGVLPSLPNRLVYPEHFPPDQFPELYYDAPEELFSRLKTLLLNQRNDTGFQDLKKQVIPYDWSNCIDTYDQVFERCFKT